MSTTSHRSTVLTEMLDTLDIPVSKQQIAAHSKHRYIFIDHGNGDQAGTIRYYLSWPEPCDNLNAVQLVAWGAATEFPAPDFVLDLDAELPLAETDGTKSRTLGRIVLLKSRYGRRDRRRIDQRARRRVFTRYQRTRSWAPMPSGWEHLDFETFWANGGIAGLLKQAKKTRSRITSIV